MRAFCIMYTRGDRKARTRVGRQAGAGTAGPIACHERRRGRGLRCAGRSHLRADRATPVAHDASRRRRLRSLRFAPCDEPVAPFGRAGTVFTCAKRAATGARGMVVTNHPLASAAGAEMLAAGGNAIDAAIAALFSLTVVEPMMVGMLGGGMAHLRTADGRHHVIDGQNRAARHGANHRHARSERGARQHGHDRPQECGRSDRGRRARQSDEQMRTAPVVQELRRKIALAGRAAATADPAFVPVPVATLLSKDDAADRRAHMSMTRAQT